MSVSKYRYTESCDGQPCPGDCDLCGKEDDMDDLISRSAAIDAIDSLYFDTIDDHDRAKEKIKRLPSAEPKQRYTKEELSVFAHGISLSLLSKRSAQHWKYDKDTATEIEFLERLYEKVGADMRGIGMAERRTDEE